MTAALMAAGCMAAAIMLIAQTGGDTPSKIQKLEQEMRQAQKDSDVTWYQKHLADGYLQGHSWGEWATKDQALKRAQDRAIKINTGDISDVKVASFGSNVAIAHYKFIYDGTFNGKHRARSVICSDTWINQSGAWKLGSSHCSHVEGP